MLKDLPQESDSLRGNVEMILDRLKPDAFLLYRCEGAVEPRRMLEAYDEAETIVAALSMDALLQQTGPRPTWSAEPMPIVRARFREHCDLPLAFDERRVVMVGHSRDVSWASFGAGGLVVPVDSQSILARTGSTVPAISAALELQLPSNSLQATLRASMRAFASAFQATTVGQFIASSVASLESLVGRDDPWTEKAQRLLQLASAEYETRFRELLAARHAFVHEARQPSSAASFLGQSAAAFVVQIWDRIARLPPTVCTLNDVLYLLRGTTGTRPLTLPVGAVERVDWIHKYASSTDPNEYHIRYVVGGRIHCANGRCGALVQGSAIRALDRYNAEVSCQGCGTKFAAFLRS